MMIRWGFAGKYSVESSQACTNCKAGKYQETAGVESVCVECGCVFAKKKHQQVLKVSYDNECLTIT